MYRFYFSTPTYDRIPAFWLALAGVSVLIGVAAQDWLAVVPAGLALQRFWSVSWQRFERRMRLSRSGWEE